MVNPIKVAVEGVAIASSSKLAKDMIKSDPIVNAAFQKVAPNLLNIISQNSVETYSPSQAESSNHTTRPRNKS